MIQDICLYWPWRLEQQILAPCLNYQEIIGKFEDDIKNFAVLTVAATLFAMVITGYNIAKGLRF